MAKAKARREYLLFETNPEKTELYEITDWPEVDKATVRASHGKFLNSDEWPESEAMSALKFGEPIWVVGVAHEAGMLPGIEIYGMVYYVGFLL